MFIVVIISLYLNHHLKETLEVYRYWKLRTVAGAEWC